MRVRRNVRKTGQMLATAMLLALLAGCAGEARPDVEPSPAPSAQVEAAPEPSATPTEQSTSRAAPIGRSVATPPTPGEVDPPVSVELPGVDITADVVAVDTADDGQMELPDDPKVVGWYRFGPAAGEGSGSVVLAGHVDSRRYGIGPLARLVNVDIGDEVVVRTEAGDLHEYAVVEVRVVPKAELPIADIFSRDGAERLVLITCTGEFDGARYKDNAVVIAEPK